MSPRVVPKWGALPPSAPPTHQEAWRRAWELAPATRPGAGSTAASTTERIHRMLLALVADPAAPAELIGQAVTAHVTEGRGAPDGVGPRGRLLLGCVGRDLWRDAWMPASLTALQESDREFPPDARLDFTVELLSRGRTPAELRPMVLAVSTLARPQRSAESIRAHLSRALDAPDVDRGCAEHLFKLLRRPGWFVVRPEGLRSHGGLDESTRSSLRRSKPIHLPITAACVLAVDDLKARDSSLAAPRPGLRKVAEGRGREAWVQPRLPRLEE